MRCGYTELVYLWYYLSKRRRGIRPHVGTRVCADSGLSDAREVIENYYFSLGKFRRIQDQRYTVFVLAY